MRCDPTRATVLVVTCAVSAALAISAQALPAAGPRIAPDLPAALIGSGDMPLVLAAGSAGKDKANGRIGGEDRGRSGDRTANAGPAAAASGDGAPGAAAPDRGDSPGASGTADARGSGTGADSGPQAGGVASTAGADPVGQAGNDVDRADAEAVARSDSWSKLIETPHLTMSLSRSKSFARSNEGDLAIARSAARAQAITTPGLTRTDADTRTSTKTAGDGEAEAFGYADAVIDGGGARVESGAETAAAVD